MSLASRRPRFGLEQIQYLLLIAGEAAWINGWSLAMGGWFGATGASPALPMVTIVGVLTVAVVGARLAATVGRQSLPARWGLSALGIATAYLIASGEVPLLMEWGQWSEALTQLFGTDPGTRAIRGIVITVLCWWRGINIGRVSPSGATVEESFRMGLVAMISLLIMVALAGSAAPLPTDSLIVSTLILVSTGLMGTPLASIAEVREQQRRRDSSSMAPVGPWLGMVTIVVGSLLLAVLMMSQLLSFDRVIGLYEAIREPVGNFLWIVVYLVALPVGFLVQLLIWLISLVPTSDKPRPPQVDPLKWLDQMGQQEPVPPSPEVILAVQVALTIAGVLLLLWLFARALRRMRRMWGTDGEDDIRDSVWSRPDLGSLLRGLLARLRPRRGFIFSHLPLHRDGHGAPKNLRELYREFLRLGTGVGRPRHPYETPLEYERRLLKESPLSGGDDLRLITEGYLQVRYAPPAPSTPELDPFASALARLRALWQAARRDEKTRREGNDAPGSPHLP